MRALPWATRVTTGYQRDSSSKRPMSSVTLVTRVRHRPWNLPLPLALDNRSFHIRLENGHPTETAVYAALSFVLITVALRL